VTLRSTPSSDKSNPTLASNKSSSVLSGSVRRAMFVLAMPVLGEQLLNTTVGIVDVFLAGQISVHATSAIGLAAYVAWLVTMLFLLVGTGTTALVARLTGAGDAPGANHIANQSLGLASVMGLGAYLMIYTLAPTVADLQKMSGPSFDIVVRYLRIDGFGHIFTSFTLIGAAAVRGVGDMRTPLKILAVVNIANLLISCALVFGVGPIPAIGIDGIVYGTVAGRIIGGLLTIAVLVQGRSGIRLRLSLMKPVADAIRRIVRIGGPAALDGMVMWSGHFVFLMLIASLADGELGRAYYAAHIIGIRVEALTYLPAVAFAAAAATMVGQSLGAEDVKRATRAGHEAVRQCGILAIGLTALYYFGADEIFRIMQQKDELVRQVGPPAMRTVAAFQIFLTTGIIYVGALRGAGDTRFPLLMTIICVGFVRLPLGYYFGIVLQQGLTGAWIGMCGDMTARAILATLRFVRGRWATTRL
jgi:MATE family, multidrug efflux pump